MNLFLDSNIYLTFYHYSKDDLEQLKKLQVAIKQNSIKLLLPEQVEHEYKRNREAKIQDALSTFSKSQIPNQFPEFFKEYDEYKELTKSVNYFEGNKNTLLAKIHADISGKNLLADKLIADLFEVATKIEITHEILEKAKSRSDRGNPPGKDHSYGDAINWEALLSYSEAKPGPIQDIHIVANDRDYQSPISSNVLSDYLADEWQLVKGGSVFFYVSLSDFFTTNFPGIKIATELEKQITIANLATSRSFATTHLTIAKLNEYSDFSNQEVNDIIDAVLGNDQVSSIVTDTDVQLFVKRLIAKYSKIINQEKLSLLGGIGVLTEDTLNPSEPGNTTTDDGLPF